MATIAVLSLTIIVMRLARFALLLWHLAWAACEDGRIRARFSLPVACASGMPSPLPYQGKDRGSDGGRIRVCELAGRPYTRDDAPIFPAHFPVGDTLPENLHPCHRPQLPPACWPEVAARARHESLRDLALAYGVSHETIRAVVKRVAATARATLAAAPAPHRGHDALARRTGPGPRRRP